MQITTLPDGRYQAIYNGIEFTHTNRRTAMERAAAKFWRQV